MRSQVFFWLLLILVPYSAKALSVDVGDIAVVRGMKGVEIEIRVDDATGIAGADLTLIYDNTVVTATQVQATALTSGLSLISNLNTPGQVRILLSGVPGISSGGGPLVRVFFDVKANAVPGDYPLELGNVQFEGVDRTIPVETASPGILTVRALPPEIRVTIGDASAQQGKKEVGVDIEVDDATGIAGADLTLTYDTSVLLATRVQTTDLTSGFSLVPNIGSPGRVRIVLVSAEGIPSGSGPLVRVFFDAKANAVPGDYSLTLVDARFEGEDQQIPVQSVSSGLFTISGQPPPETGIRISVGNTTAERGAQSVGVDIQVDDATGIAGADLLLTYDTSALMATDVRTTELTSGFALVPNLATPGQVRIMLVGAEGISSGNGPLVEVIFSVKRDAAPGEYPLVLFHYQFEGIAGSMAVQDASPGSFTVTGPVLEKISNLLIVADYQDTWLDSLLPYYTRPLENQGFTYDVWNSSALGEIDAGTLRRYKDGAVIWFTPWGGGYLVNPSTRDALKSYLLAGGSLVITGQDIGSSIGDTEFYQSYLHAQFVRENEDDFLLAGRDGDPVTGGIDFLVIQGGEGAHNQQNMDEINAVFPAVPILSYDYHSARTAALRVDTETFKAIYLAFGFEGIDQRENQEQLLLSVLKWLIPFSHDEIKIFSIDPDKGFNQGLVTLTINGVGFDSNATVKLSRPGYQDIIGVNNSGNSDIIITTFDLTGVDLGNWNVVVVNPNGEKAVSNIPFTIESGYVNLWTEIIGRNQFRTGRSTRYIIRFGNQGNMDANWVPLSISGIPKDADYELEGINLDEIPIQTEENEVTLPLIVPTIPAGSSEALPLSINTPDAQSSTLRTRLYLPLVSPTPVPVKPTPTPTTIKFQWRNPECWQAILSTCLSAIGIFNPSTEIIRCSIQLAAEGVGVFSSHVSFKKEKISSWLEIIKSYLSLVLNDCFGIKALEKVSPLIGQIMSAIDTVKGFFAIKDACFGEPLAESELNLNPVASIDPNEKIGVRGVGKRAFVTGDISLPYIINFENLKSATAPAQEVFITDQLDTTNLEIESLSLGIITLGEDIQIDLPAELSEFSKEIDLRPEMDLLLHIEAKLDKETGILKWIFQSLDPTTGDLPEDPLAGFLPPNKNPPEGEGSVFFTIKLKSGLASGTEIRNKASIVFDVNAPIITNEVVNTIDVGKPHSHIETITNIPLSPHFYIHWSGRDNLNESGIKNFTIYVAEDGGVYSNWINSTSDTSAVYPGKGDHTYWFYSISRDFVGNLENQPEIPDIKVLNASYNFKDPGWHQIFFPHKPPVDSLAVLFPSATSAHIWDAQQQTHVAVSRLDTALGYWVDIPSPVEYFIAGIPVEKYTVHLEPGWHLIGSVVDEQDISDFSVDPEGSVISCFEWNPSKQDYQPASKLEPKKGYWIAVLQECDLTVGEVGASSKRHRIDSQKMELFFEKYGSTPPLPPARTAPNESLIIPSSYELRQNYPNPFNSDTVIEFSLPKPELISVIIYNILGQPVKTLVDTRIPAGNYRITWDGKTEEGTFAASGVYFYRIISDHYLNTKKMLLLR